MTVAGPLVIAIDQGTTSTRCALVSRRGRIVAMAQEEHSQSFPRPGWVEHDAAEIWSNAGLVVEACLSLAGVDGSAIACVGITNQRETTVAWDDDGRLLGPAIVWQDTRTADICREMEVGEGPGRFRARTGLPLATYFSGPKMRWMLDHLAAVREAASDGRLRLGTVDSWIAWNLTGRHVTDVTNASRTMLMGLDSLDWSAELLGAFGIDRRWLPGIVASSARIGTVQGGPLSGVPVTAIIGDQQAALFGQACFAPGDAKCTYGTGCFLLANTGTEPVPSERGLLTTVAYQVEGEAARYALEGSVGVAGAAVQWLRDGLGIIDSPGEVEALAGTVPDNGDVYFVPAFSGLFAPHWRADARGVVVGLTAHSGAGHIARAVLEAVAHQTADVLEAMRDESGRSLLSLSVDGGMVVNELLMQFQADLLGLDVVRPRDSETTVLGAAFAAGLAAGVWGGLDEVAHTRAVDRTFTNAMEPVEREARRQRWRQAVERSHGWVTEAAD